MENLTKIESKVKHCATSTDSLHVKSNILDTKINKVVIKQVENQSDIENLKKCGRKTH